MPKLDSSLIEKVSPYEYVVRKGFVPNMYSDARFYVNDALKEGIFEELSHQQEASGGGFLPAVQQLANVASLPGQVGLPCALPDIHSGYGFSIGGVAAFDLADPNAIICPGGIGFDINCGVRLIRTNLKKSDVEPLKERLADTIFETVPVGVGSSGAVSLTRKDLDDILNTGVNWAVDAGYAWPEDKLNCEELGSMTGANSNKVSHRAKTRGLTQLGTLGAGNHYLEIQTVDEVFDVETATAFGLEKDQVCVMIHCGSRGLGHQVASDYIQVMEKWVKKNRVELNDRQLAYAPFSSTEGQDYYGAMAASANFAWCNRQLITHLVRLAFEKVFGRTAHQLDMHLVYDVSHNIAKIEEMDINGVAKRILVHRKGATRALPPQHPLVPTIYADHGHPVLIGGSQSDCSYVLAGLPGGSSTFYSSCHGAGRALSRHAARRQLTPSDVLNTLKSKNISIRVSTPKLLMEEASESYKSVDEVVETCHEAGLSKLVVKLRPLAVIKG
ncbi:hypothetical protein RCL1_000851 [Eukaryota sp. TZLM3-RCL]